MNRENDMAKEDPRVTAKKKRFLLELFNIEQGSPGWQGIALRDATVSALQRNPIYSPGTSHARRKEFRDAWGVVLTKIAAEYEHGMKDRAQFEDDILRLQKEMNAQFRPMLQTASTRCDPGFRISHAQKSLSLFLKHYWCHNHIDEPPACPVDRMMLTEAKAPYSKRTWTSVNTMDGYREQLGYLEKAGNDDGETVAVWELLKFR